MNSKARFLAVFPVLLMMATPALAHNGPHAAGGVVAGIVHPFTGIDHLVAMILVGVWAVRIGGRAVWALPAAFLASMTVGFGMASVGIALSYYDVMIAASVLVLGLLVVFAAKPAAWASTALVAGFALFHGYAHGAERAGSGTNIAYIVGFVAATALLHLAGAWGSIALRQRYGDRPDRAAGTVATLIGLGLLAALS